MNPQDILQYPIVRGVLAGVAVAAVVDYDAFRKWRSFDDAMAYDWKTASWRWFQGAVIGALAGLGVVV